MLTAGDLENQAELEEKTRLINQVLELQHTLEGMTHTHTHTTHLLNTSIVLAKYFILVLLRALFFFFLNESQKTDITSKTDVL